MLSDAGLTVRSITMTACTLGITFSKDIALAKPNGLIAINRNLDNVTATSSDGSIIRLDVSKANKARWEGLPVFYVNPAGTSAKCSICGGKMKPEENRMLKCRSCRFKVDRDLNAAKNILARGMRFVPGAPQKEAMVREPVIQQVIPQSIAASQVT